MMGACKVSTRRDRPGMVGGGVPGSGSSPTVFTPRHTPSKSANVRLRSGRYPLRANDLQDPVTETVTDSIPPASPDTPLTAAIR